MPMEEEKAQEKKDKGTPFKRVEDAPHRHSVTQHDAGKLISTSRV